MKRFTFSLGLALIFIGLAISEGINYLDLRQFETRVGGFVLTSSPSQVSGIRRSLEAKDEFSKKYFTPKMSAILLDDYSRIDADNKSNLQEILRSVSQKKSQALKSMSSFLFLASLCLIDFWVIRKSRSKQT